MTDTVDPPDATVLAWADQFARVSTERVALSEARGRVLAQSVCADRDSPADDVSAMDGYAVRRDDFDEAGRLPVAGEVKTGCAPPPLPPGQALRIFTGGCVPAGAELVIKREDLAETRELIELRIDRAALRPGQHIRARGENCRQGDTLCAPGCLVTPSVVGLAAGFGATSLGVYRKLRVGLLVTGDELLGPESSPEPWLIRDSNGPALAAMLRGVPWIDLVDVQCGTDDPTSLARQMSAMLERCDALITTGGVSMGDHDYIPAVLESVGGTTTFHKLPIRPGKPMLGGVGTDGQAFLGLPGNPVSAMVTLRRFGLAGLRRRAGFAAPLPPPASAVVTNDDGKSLGLWRYRLVRLTTGGDAELVASMGSGDVASVAQSDGLVEVPPDTIGATHYAFYPWPIS